MGQKKIPCSGVGGGGCCPVSRDTGEVQNVLDHDFLFGSPLLPVINGRSLGPGSNQTRDIWHVILAS